MKRKGIVIALCAMATTVLTLFASGCAASDKIKQWKCDHDYGAAATETVKEATCTEQGKELWTCRKCDKEKTVKTDKLPHAWDEGEIVEESTCLKTGLMTYTCTVCESTKDEVTPIGDHKRVEVAQVDPTCEATGTTAYVYCETCNGFLVPKKTIPALGHTEVKDAAVAPTCTESGLTEGSHCARCEEVVKVQTVVLATGHTPVTVAGKEATCTETGLTSGSECSTCKTVLIAQEEIPMTAHTPVTVEGYAATCTEAGLTDGSKCSVCDVELTAQEVLSATGHTPVTVAGKAATCTSTGLTDGTKCGVCDVELTAQEEIPMTAHTYDGDNTCGVCGEEYYTEGLAYTLSSDESYYTVSENEVSKNTKNIVIPAYYNNKPVTHIAANFPDQYDRYNYITESIYMPDTITHIEERFAAYCEKLKSVRLSKNIERWVPSAFDGCDQLVFEKEIELLNIGPIVGPILCKGSGVEHIILGENCTSVMICYAGGSAKYTLLCPTVVELSYVEATEFRVPAELLDEYKATYTDMADKFVAIEETATEEPVAMALSLDVEEAVDTVVTENGYFATVATDDNDESVWCGPY